MLNLYTISFEKPVIAPEVDRFPSGHTYWHVVAESYEAALAEIRRHAPDAVIRSISQQNYAGSPVVLTRCGTPFVAARQAAEAGSMAASGANHDW